MQGESYRLKAQTLGIISTNQRRAAILIPQNAMVTVINGPLNGNRMVDVMWDEQIVMIFVEDLRARGETIDPDGNPVAVIATKPTSQSRRAPSLPKEPASFVGIRRPAPNPERS